MIISEIFSLTRLWAVIVKEFIQMWRDKGTFAMMVLLPIIQLCIFGYAINSDPKSLPAGLIVNDTSRFSRTIIKSLETSTILSLHTLFLLKKKPYVFYR